MAGALEGVKVIEFSSYITGPFAGMLLADMGAEVIKVEAPPYGDPFRGTGKALTPIFCSINRSKKSVAINLKTPEGRDAFLRLADDAAVVIQNHRPGYVDHLGIGYEAVSARNPSIVYCSISGFGEDGPYRDLPGYDVIGMSMGGLQSVLTDVTNPKPAEISFGDHLTGVFANYGILSALYRRATTGQGQRVDTSLLQSMVAFMGDTVAGYSATGKLPQVDGRGGRTRQAHCFLGNDGLPFSIHLSSPLKFFTGLMEAIGKPELAEDPRFLDREPRAQNYDLLHDICQEVFATNTRDHWVQRLRECGVPSGPLNTIPEVLEDPQVKNWGLPIQVKRPGGDPISITGSTVQLSETPPTFGDPPLLGEHNEEVFKSLGYSAEEIAALAGQVTA